MSLTKRKQRRDREIGVAGRRRTLPIEHCSDAPSGLPYKSLHGLTPLAYLASFLRNIAPSYLARQCTAKISDLVKYRTMLL